jgi:hypothetical protein
MGKFAFVLIVFGVMGLVSSYSQAKDLDSDNDGISDHYERMLKTAPNDPSSTPSDLDKDGIPDEYDLDVDGDGINNWQDPFPRIAQANDVDGTQDSDGDGFTNAEERAADTNSLDAKSFPDSDDPILELLELPDISSAQIVDVRGMALDLGMGMKKIQVVNADGDIFPGHFEYTTHFKIKVKLNRGENQLQVAAFDKANNVSRQFVTINH